MRVDERRGRVGNGEQRQQFWERKGRNEMKPKIYIAGPMSGIPNNNRDAFNAAANRLAAKGWQPVNPVDVERILPCIDDDGQCDVVELARLMQVLRHIVAMCDALYLLNGFENSNGVRIELTAFAECHDHRTLDSIIFQESGGVPNAKEAAK